MTNDRKNPGEEKRTVQSRRRRRSDPPDPGGRERAEAPRRRREREQAAPTPRPRPTRPDQNSGGQRPPSLPSIPSGGLPGGGLKLSPLVIGILVVVGICVIGAFLLLSPSGDGDVAFNPPAQGDGAVDAVIQPSPLPRIPTSTPKPFAPPSTTTGDGTWLVMLYQDADDKILEQDIYVDLNEAERVGSSDRVHIVAQLDRYKAGYQGDGDWTTTKRFYITQDDDLGRVNSQVVADLGEVNMSAGETLVDFAAWAIETYPADKHVLILSDHGMGWPGGWSDPAPGGSGDRSIPLAAKLGDELYLMEMDAALAEIRARTGMDKFELIGMDACLMGHLEVFNALAPHARYAVASQETEPALGWAYTGFLDTLTANPGISGAELSRLIVDSYIQDDQRIVDDQARAEMMKRGSPLGGLFSLFSGGMSAEQLAQQMSKNITLTAVDLEALPELLNNFNDLVYSLQDANQPDVAQARTYAQSFTSIFGKDVPPSYIDLGNFVQLLVKESGSRDLAQAAGRLLASLDEVVIAEKHGPNKSGATGISIYFPNSKLYKNPVTGAQSYTAIADRFAGDTLWDDFLAYHYTGRTFDPAPELVAVPSADTPISAPGAGPVEVSPVTLSASVAAPNRPVVLSADIHGQNIGHVYLFVGFYDQASNSIFVADRDYLESDETREIGGVYYPYWGEGEFTMAFEWEPIVFAISDGVDSVVALFKPQSYGAVPEEATYTVDGIYTYADGGETRYARLYFSDGYLRQVFGFTSDDGTGAAREITPQSGDRFTVLEKWLDLDQRGAVVGEATQEGGTLTFADQMFTWEELYAAPGEYIVGFVVEDLDGNSYETYTEVTVE